MSDPTLDDVLRVMKEHRAPAKPAPEAAKAQPQTRARALLERVLTPEQIRTLKIDFGTRDATPEEEARGVTTYGRVKYNGTTLALVPDTRASAPPAGPLTVDEMLRYVFADPEPDEVYTDIYEVTKTLPGGTTSVAVRVREAVPGDRLWLTILELLLPHLKD